MLIRRFGKMSRTAMSQFICLPVRTGSGTRAPGPSFRSTWRRPGAVILFPAKRREKNGSSNEPPVGGYFKNSTFPVLTSYMAPTIPISPLSSIPRSTTLLSRSFPMVSSTFFSATAWTKSVFFELLGS